MSAAANRNAPSRILSVRETSSLLKSFGLPLAASAIVRTREEALSAAAKITYPVALKTASPFVLHKTEEKGVVLNVSSEAELTAAISAIHADEFLIQKMARSGHEIFVGARRDQEFGPVVLFGSGGTEVELYKDVSMHIAPIDGSLAREMIEETKAGALLGGYRGREPSDKNAVVQFLVQLSRLLIKHSEIVDIDINPLIVYGRSEGCVIVDARIRVATPG